MTAPETISFEINSRDYIAIAALQGLLSNELVMAQHRGIDALNNQKNHAQAAYQYADAMLEERNKS